MRRPVFTIRLIVAGALFAAAAVGFAVQGWPGIVLFSLALAFGVLIAGVGFLVVRFGIGVALLSHRTRTAVNGIQARLSRLPTDELRAIGASPAHPDFGFAVGALARRGIEIKPQRDALLEMLVSPHCGTRGNAMAFLMAFYPEVRLPLGSSSHDPPEVWRERVTAIKAAS